MCNVIFSTSGPTDTHPPPPESCESPYSTLLYSNVCESKVPTSLAWDRLRDHSGGPAQPLCSTRKSAQPRLTGPLALQGNFYWVQPTARIGV